MKFNKLFLLLLPLSLAACNNQKKPEKPDPSLLTTPLCMTCTSDNVDGLINVFHSTTIPEVEFSLQYSRDNKKWHDVEFTYRQSTFNLKKDETIYFRGNNPEGFNRAHFDETKKVYIPDCLTMFAAASGTVSLGGNVMSLLSPTNFDKLTEIPCDYCFGMLFTNYESYSFYTDASKLSLPATKLKESCYTSMFVNNKLLEYAPILPATSLVKDCYYRMFNKCPNLKKLQVAFNETAFEKSGALYPYTTDWLNNSEDTVTNDGEPIFIWPGPTSGFSFEQNVSTIPEGWIIQKAEVL